MEEKKRNSGRTGPKRTLFQRERDLVLVSEMYLKLYPQYQIANLLNAREGIEYTISPEAIADDIGEIRKRWLKAQVNNAEQAKVEQLKKIDDVEHQAWLAWERSLMPISRTETKAVKQSTFREAPLTPTGYVYVMYNASNKKHKIGHSKTPAKREKTLQSTEPDITMLFYFEGSRRDEQALQNMFAEKNVRGEWFEGLDDADFEKIKQYIEDLKVARIEHGQEPADNTPDKIERKVFEATSEGNPQFLNIILACIEKRTKLLALTSVKVDMTVKGSVLVLPDSNRTSVEDYNEEEIQQMLVAAGENHSDEE